ncbi:hypothetical protein LUQ84_000211 [Hamiltosporidium tvaerminnensis]|nr:hypothetical protein LUQ84_000211 [Hamiltosporidium tvaerminnensis]
MYFVNKRISLHFILLATYILIVSLTTVTVYIINEKNFISNSVNNDHKKFIGEKIEYSDENSQIKIGKNNIISYESELENKKYYKPNIITLPYVNNMLLNLIHLKSLFDVEKNNIRVFIRDVSYSSFLLFLDILIIISILDIKKSKERNELIKELLRSLLYGINRVSFDFDLDNEYINFFNYTVKRSIMRYLLVFFLKFVYF